VDAAGGRLTITQKNSSTQRAWAPRCNYFALIKLRSCGATASVAAWGWQAKRPPYEINRTYKTYEQDAKEIIKGS
jgi:hypothetical protein